MHEKRSHPFNIVLIGTALMLGIVAYGLVLLHLDKDAFLVWIREDGFVEWLTFAELIALSAIAFLRSATFKGPGNITAPWKLWLLFGFIFLFGAMEEISWGQRIFGIQSPQWFMEHNRQGETNIHNLVIYGINLNKHVFGTILGILITLYVLVVPLFYHFRKGFREALDRLGMPVARMYQIFLFVLLFTVVQIHLGLSKKVGELLEFGNCFLFFLILLHPFNAELD